MKKITICAAMLLLCGFNKLYAKDDCPPEPLTSASQVYSYVPGCNVISSYNDGHNFFCGGCSSGYTYDDMIICPGMPWANCISTCTNTCLSSGTTSCGVSNGTGVKTNTGGNNCTGSCTYGTCTVTSCNSGYYKSSATACTKCPTVPIGWTTISGGVKSKNGGMNGSSDCYTEGTFSDGTGTFEISGSNCIY